MGEDVPLTEFDSSDDSGDDDSEDPQPESVESDDPADPAEADAAETPSLTYTSSPDGAPCAACGETVERRWRAGEGGVTPDENGAADVDEPDALVCPDCKEW